MKLLWPIKDKRDIIRYFVPPVLRDLFNYYAGYAIYYRGEFGDWSAACAASSGYDSDALLRRLEEAAEATKMGEAAWEQDGVTWDHIPVDMPLFAVLSRVALAQESRLSVLDFGGALGSSYFQCREFLTEVRNLTWGIVEQLPLVVIGRRTIERDALRFYASIDDAIAAQHPNVALFSSVLQYLENPWAVLDQIIASKIPYLVIDRHPCSINREMITVQVVPRSLYPASYPSWLFDCPRMLMRLERHYALLASWDGKDPPIRGWRKGAEFRGFFFQRRWSEQ